MLGTSKRYEDFLTKRETVLTQMRFLAQIFFGGAIFDPPESADEVSADMRSKR